MIYRLLADPLVVTHAAYVAFVVLGQVAILVGLALRRGWARNFGFRTVHLAMIGIVVVEAIFGIACPLTVWEKELRRLAGQSSYPGDFLGHWGHELLFFQAGLTTTGSPGSSTPLPAASTASAVPRNDGSTTVADGPNSDVLPTASVAVALTDSPADTGAVKPNEKAALPPPSVVTVREPRKRSPSPFPLGWAAALA